MENLTKNKENAHEKNGEKKYEGELGSVLKEGGEYADFIKSLEKNGKASKETAIRLIDGGHGRDVARYLSKFDGLDSEVAYKLIDSREWRVVVENIDKFKGLKKDKQLAIKLIDLSLVDKWQWSLIYVANKISEFEGLDKEVANKLIDSGCTSPIAYYSNLFVGLDKEIVLKLIKTMPIHDVRYLAKNITNFKGLDKEVAENLIEIGEGWAVVEYIDEFEGINKEEAEILIENWKKKEKEKKRKKEKEKKSKFKK